MNIKFPAAGVSSFCASSLHNAVFMIAHFARAVNVFLAPLQQSFKYEIEKRGCPAGYPRVVLSRTQSSQF